MRELATIDYKKKVLFSAVWQAKKQQQEKLKAWVPHKKTFSSLMRRNSKSGYFSHYAIDPPNKI
jgi:hypothetical protein